MRIAELKIKIKSLAAESRIIREDERKYGKKGRRARLASAEPGLEDKKRHHRERHANAAFVTENSLRSHRAIVGAAARTALLALLFLRHKPYAVAERPNTRVAPDWEQVETTAIRFGLSFYHAKAKDSAPHVELRQRFAAWREAAETHLGQQQVRVAV